MTRPVPTRVANPGRLTVARGISLVEIMIALVLGLFLMAGLLQVLSSSRMAYRLAEATARAQENGRYALQFLSREVRPSRSNLCRNIIQDEMESTFTVHSCALLATPDTCSGEARLGRTLPLGYSVSEHGTSAWLAGLPGASSAGAQAAVGQAWLRGDVLVSWGAVGEGFYAATNTLTQGVPPARDLTQPVTFITGITAAMLDQAGLKAGNLAMITDCNHSDVFTISSIVPGGSSTAAGGLAHAVNTTGTDAKQVNKEASLAHAYNDSTQWATSPRARVIPFDYRVFFSCCMNQQDGQIQSGTAGVANCGTTPLQYRPGLCRWSANSGTAMIAFDIADLRVRYEGRLDPTSAGTPVRFSDTYPLPNAAKVQEKKLWDRVYSARVELLVTSSDPVRTSDVLPVPPTTKTADNLGWNMAADRWLYQTFSTTIAIRSRSPWYRDE